MRFMFFFFKQKTAYEMRISDGVQTVLFRSGLSADHIEHSSEASVRAMAAAGTVAVLLPGAFHVLRETVLPPLDALRAHGVPMRSEERRVGKEWVSTGRSRWTL